jgi:hypothetical protein
MDEDKEKKDKKEKKKEEKPEYIGEYVSAPEGLDQTKISRERRADVRESAYREKYEEKFICKICGAEYKSQKELDIHISKKHMKKERNTEE